MAKVLKRIGIVLLVILLVLALTVGGYVLYVTLQYYRIPDNTALDVENPQQAALKTGEAYTALTYNIGFGAYNHDFSFFMDSGTMLDGTPVQGTMGRAQSADIVNTNTSGVIGALQTAAPDFCLLQEADVDATRSFHIDQTALIRTAMPAYASVYASNFHSAFLFYPLTEPHGSVEAGLLTLSKHAVDTAVRRSYPVDDSFPTKFFDLDRCFAELRIPVEGADGRQLVLINSHMSAYDKGGTVRQRQLALLNSVLAEEYAKGNWVIVGGDFNHALCDTVNTFPTQQQVPAWVFTLGDDDLTDGFSVVRADNVTEVPTCRSTDMPYTKGVNYSAVLDGFIVSDNVTAAAHNIDLDFDYSDHNPVQLTFTLN